MYTFDESKRQVAEHVASFVYDLIQMWKLRALLGGDIDN